jgi:hypothetical protein
MWSGSEPLQLAKHRLYAPPSTNQRDEPLSNWRLDSTTTRQLEINPVGQRSMKFVPETERREWHDKALNAAEGADLHSQLELFIETGEMEKLAALVSSSTDQALEAMSHYATEPAAKRLDDGHPNLAARLWRAQGSASLMPRRASTTTPRFRISNAPGIAI